MRRRLILAGEDIGRADPSGIVVVTACANALQYVGLPEAKYHLRRAADGPAPRDHSYEGHWVAQQYLPDVHKDRLSTMRVVRLEFPRRAW